MPTETLTDRLILTPIEATTETAELLFAIQSDPETWRHLPTGVETDISQSRTMAEDQARSWRDQGLGWWLIRLRDSLGELDAGAVIGLGGAAVRRPEVRAWNLGYRLTPASWGHGFAGEAGRAALAAARDAQPDLPVTARALTHNPASWRTLERIGLSLAWEGDAAAGYPLTSGMKRRIYADRELSPALLDQLVGLG